MRSVPISTFPVARTRVLFPGCAVPNRGGKTKRQTAYPSVKSLFRQFFCEKALTAGSDFLFGPSYIGIRGCFELILLVGMFNSTGDARPRFSEYQNALLEEQVRRARSVDGRLSTYNV